MKSKMPIKNKVTTRITLIIGILLFGCSKSPETKILGTWMAEDGTRMEFFEDSTVTLQQTQEKGLSGLPVSGTWTRLSDGRFKMSLSMMGFTTTNAFEASFPDRQSMEIEMDGETMIMKRQ
ncbi:MAG: hypothetical protein JJU29_21530 [Verrucomicrobia bacterium]|nr:hypothetical protein [Verrucomicrobiota bacterium]MCH8512367.1 hypothetical protein [Kiritimatiellia bacterium]